MNYRHAFHAGNFADVLKHAVLLDLLARVQAGRGRLTVLDTHAGAGLYDLDDAEAARSGEAEAGVARLTAGEGPPPAAEALRAAVGALNGGGRTRFYPGSPVLAAARLRPGDAYVGCELRPDDFALLQRALRPYAGARALKADGFETAAALEAPDGLLALIDPPFERGDDYDRIARATAAILGRSPEAAIAIWAPLKDMETLDALVRRLEAACARAVEVIELRLRPLDNPMRLNGCAVLMIGAPEGAAASALQVARWAADALGGPGGEGRAWRAGG